MYVALPVSLTEHVWATYYLYDIAFPACSLAPYLIAWAVGVIRSGPPRAACVRRLPLPVAAVILSAAWPEALTVDSIPIFSPFRAVLLAATLVYALDYARNRSRLSSTAAVLSLGTAALGHSVVAVLDHVVRMADLLVFGIERPIPRTPAQWGWLSMAWAFVCLGLGAWLSLRRSETPLARSGDKE